MSKSVYRVWTLRIAAFLVSISRLPINVLRSRRSAEISQSEKSNFRNRYRGAYPKCPDPVCHGFLANIRRYIGARAILEIDIHDAAPVMHRPGSRICRYLRWHFLFTRRATHFLLSNARLASWAHRPSPLVSQLFIPNHLPHSAQLARLLSNWDPCHFPPHSRQRVPAPPISMVM